MRFAEFRRILDGFGFTLHPTSGSHHIYKHPDVPRRLNIQSSRGEAKPHQIEEFLEMVEKFGLEMKK